MTKTRTPARVCSRIGLALFLMMLAWYAAATAGTMLVQSFAPALLGNGWFLWALNDVPLYLAGMPVFLLVLRGLSEVVTDSAQGQPSAAAPLAPRYRPPLGVGRFSLILVFCLGAAYLLNMVATLLLMLFSALVSGGGLGESALDQLAMTGSPLASLVFGVAVPAVGEEFLFRYVLRRKLLGSGDKIYIFFSAFCFALFHANFVQTPYTFVIGAILAWLYVIGGRLWLSMLIHFIINLLGIVVMPWLLQTSELAASLYGMFAMFVLIPAAIALFVVFHRRVFIAMQPPTEPGWPYRQTRPKWRDAGRPPEWPADPNAPVAPEPPPVYAAHHHAGARPYWQGYGHPSQAAYLPAQAWLQGYPAQPPYAAGPAAVYGLPRTAAPYGWNGWNSPAGPAMPGGPGAYGLNPYAACDHDAPQQGYGTVAAGFGPAGGVTAHDVSGRADGSPGYGVPYQHFAAREGAVAPGANAPPAPPPTASQMAWPGAQAAWNTEPGCPYPRSGPQGYPPYQPQGGAGWVYGYQAPSYGRREARAVGVCLGNTGMVMYIVLAGLLMLVGLLGTLMLL